MRLFDQYIRMNFSVFDNGYLLMLIFISVRMNHLFKRMMLLCRKIKKTIQLESYKRNRMSIIDDNSKLWPYFEIDFNLLSVLFFTLFILSLVFFCVDQVFHWHFWIFTLPFVKKRRRRRTISMHAYVIYVLFTNSLWNSK
jgi:hypothetical protein